MLSALVLAMSALSVTWRRGFYCEPASPFGLVSPQHSWRSPYQHSSSTPRRFRRRPSCSQLRLHWASVAWLRGPFTQPRRRQRRTPQPLRRRSECCNKRATSANSLDPWRWDFGSRISAGMPHQASSPLQPCSASRPLSPFGEQCGARLPPTARDSRLETPMISPNRNPTTLPRPLLSFRVPDRGSGNPTPLGGWGQHLWARGCWIVSSGKVTDEMRVDYIKKQ